MLHFTNLAACAEGVYMPKENILSSSAWPIVIWHLDYGETKIFRLSCPYFSEQCMNPVRLCVYKSVFMALAVCLLTASCCILSCQVCFCFHHLWHIHVSAMGSDCCVHLYAFMSVLTAGFGAKLLGEGSTQLLSAVKQKCNT